MRALEDRIRAGLDRPDTRDTHRAAAFEALLRAAEPELRWLRGEVARLTAWLERIDGGDEPCTDESQLRQWAYEALVLRRTP